MAQNAHPGTTPSRIIGPPDGSLAEQDGSQGAGLVVRARSGTIVIFSDSACPWSHVAVWHLWETRENTCVTMRHEILDTAAACGEVDVPALTSSLDEGRFRSQVIEDAAEVARSGVRGSPHLFLPDGADVHNPGIDMHWVEGNGGDFPVVDSFEPRIYEEILERATKGER